MRSGASQALLILPITCPHLSRTTRGEGRCPLRYLPSRRPLSTGGWKATLQGPGWVQPGLWSVLLWSKVTSLLNPGTAGRMGGSTLGAWLGQPLGGERRTPENESRQAPEGDVRCTQNSTQKCASPSAPSTFPFGPCRGQGTESGVGVKSLLPARRTQIWSWISVVVDCMAFGSAGSLL